MDYFWCINLCLPYARKDFDHLSNSILITSKISSVQPGSSWIFLIDVHDDVIKWKHFPRYWPFVRGIHRSAVNSLHKGQWRAALMLSLICAWISGWVNNHVAGDLRRHRAHFDVTNANSIWITSKISSAQPASSWIFLIDVNDQFESTFQYMSWQLCCRVLSGILAQEK